MSEKRKILEHVVEYLQDKIDTGYHKIFYNDDMYDEKTIDCINAINDSLEENERLNNIINKAIEYLESYNTDFKNCRFGEAPISIRELGDLLNILKGVDKE